MSSLFHTGLSLLTVIVIPTTLSAVSRAGQSPAPTHNRLGSGFAIFAFLLEIGPEQLKILNGSQEEENADKKVFHKKPGIKDTAAAFHSAHKAGLSALQFISSLAITETFFPSLVVSNI